MKRIFSLIISLVLLARALPQGALAARDEEVLFAEGESYVRCIAVQNSEKLASALSGGKALIAKAAKDKIPAEGCIYQYKFKVDAPGLYTLNMICSPYNKNTQSPFELRINDGEYQKAKDLKPELLGNLNDTDAGTDLFYKYKFKPMEFKKGVNDVFIKIADGRQMDGSIYWYFDCMSIEKAPWTITSLEGSYPLNIMEEGDKFDLELKIPSDGETTHKVSYEVYDYFGKLWGEGSQNVTGKSSIAVNLNGQPVPGHYRVICSIDDAQSGKEFYFSVVSRDIPQSADSHFAVDTAGAMYISETRIADYARSLRLAGIGEVRERYYWSQLYNDDGTYDWNARKHQDYYNNYTDNGIKYMLLNNHTPNVFKDGNNVNIIGNDLLGIYKFAKEATQHYGDAGTIEYWNEPDLTVKTNETADKFAAYAKAMSIGIVDADPSEIKICPGIAYPPSLWTKLLVMNDVMDYLDTYSYHSHRHVTTLEPESNVLPLPNGHRNHLDFAKQYGFDDKLIYNTEAGISNMQGEEGKNTMFITQLVKARYCATSMIQTAVDGVDKHFWFLYGNYTEKNAQWGGFTEDHMPMAVYNTLATLNDVLGSAEYVGYIPQNEATVYVFQDGDKQIACMWSENEENITLNSDAAGGELVNIMGAYSDIEATDGEFTVTASPDIQFVKINGCFEGIVDNVRKADIEHIYSFTDAQRVIIQQQFPEENNVNAKILGYTLDASKPTEVTVILTNLNDKVMSGTVNGTAVGGWKVSPQSAPVTIEPYSTAQLKFTVTGKNVDSEYQVPIRFDGVFNGEKTSKSITYIMDNTEAEVEPEFIITEYSNPENWVNNILVGSVSEITADENGYLNLKYEFAAGDRWSYPYFDIPEGYDLEGSKGIVYEAWFPDDVEKVNLKMYATEKNGARYLNSTVNHDAVPGWNIVKIPWTVMSASGSIPDDNYHLDPEQLVQLQIGLNLKGEKNSIEYKIRNFGVYYANESDVYSTCNILSPNSVTGGNVEIKAELFEYQTGIDYSTLRVEVDNEEVAFEINNGLLTANTVLENGEHAVKVIFTDLNGLAVQKVLNFTVEN